ncbi:hypothetical protein BDV37DRAFT_172203 [Aspergillus pseudonomiae]|uniref:Uncharacterized protein n=1 Tax=Aspergillus pseudonomiae TaxID=1506151 RepID=A0A5N7DQU8_9EURO|nr:uncharacterized protein BDV37DRAFT_172203 [Aspergillus pseudonomiae]KAE8408423.1 hypothetical protein BDV37DRAFT_172203 [Aspergillus pseudonomiae]
MSGNRLIASRSSLGCTGSGVWRRIEDRMLAANFRSVFPNTTTGNKTQESWPIMEPQRYTKLPSPARLHTASISPKDENYQMERDRHPEQCLVPFHSGALPYGDFFFSFPFLPIWVFSNQSPLVCNFFFSLLGAAFLPFLPFHAFSPGRCPSADS